MASPNLHIVSNPRPSAIARGLTHHSSQREKVFEHLFLSQLGLELIARGVSHEVLHGEVDDHGYDIAIEAGGILRHIQLKVTILGGARAEVGIHTRLSDKPAGCVIWLTFDPSTRDFESIRWFGGKPDQRLPDLGAKIGRHTRGNSAGVKASRPAIRIVSASRFERLDNFAHLADRLFGLVPLDPLAFLYSRLDDEALAGSTSLPGILSDGFAAIPQDITFDNGGIELASLIDGYRMLEVVSDEQSAAFLDRQRAALDANGQWPGDALMLWITLSLMVRADRFAGGWLGDPAPHLDQLCGQLRTALVALENGNA